MNIIASIGKWGIRLAPGLAVFLTALTAPQLRSADGWLMPNGWALAVFGLALLLLLVAWGTAWQKFVGLLALALAGQACALHLIDAPPYSVYQRYFSWNQEELSWSKLVSSWRGIFIFGIVCQTAVLFLLSRGFWSRIKAQVARLLTTQKLILLVAFLIFAGTLFSQDVLHFGFEVAVAVWISLVSALNLILAAAAIPKSSIEKITRWLTHQFSFNSEAAIPVSRIDLLLPLIVATWVTLVAAIITWSVFERVPHIPDDVSYLFQAKYFSSGRLYLPSPPEPAAFAISHVVNDGAKWFAYGFPGWPTILAIGVLAGIPWMVNPILAGLTILLVHTLVRRLYNRPLAHATVVLLAVSPVFLFTAASFMGHTVSTVWVLLALLAIEKEGGRGRVFWGVICGVCLGALFLTRPFEGILVGSVVGLRALGFAGKRMSVQAIAGLILAGILVAGLIFPYNYVLTGNPTYGPHMKFTDEMWYPGADRIGFGPDVGNLGWPHYDPLPGHGPLDVVINLNKNFYMTNFELFGWGFGSLIFVALALLFNRAVRSDWLFIAIIFSVVVGHSFYWSPGGPDFGARYWYQLLIPFVLLTARGVQGLQQRLVENGAGRHVANRTLAFVGMASLIAFVNVVPWRSLGKYHNYRGMSAEVQRLSQKHGFGHSLVILRPQEPEDYASAFIFNPSTLERSGTIYALDAGPTHTQTLRQHFPDRPLWIIGRYPSATDPMRVLAGPLSPTTQIEDAMKMAEAHGNFEAVSRQ